MVRKDGPQGSLTEAENDNTPFDPKAWRKKYMKTYMQKRRDRIRAEKALAKEQSS